MEKMDLQQTAENVIDLESRMINWRGSVAGWLNELSRLGESIENMSRDTRCDKDPVQEEFLKCLQLKTNHCREHVLSRVEVMGMATTPVFPSYY
jgi:hypothetical protein